MKVGVARVQVYKEAAKYKIEQLRFLLVNRKEATVGVSIFSRWLQYFESECMHSSS